jgi:hypothetical protein
MREHSIWVVVEKYNNTKRDDDYRYAGSPCIGYEEALDLMHSHTIYGNECKLCKLVDWGVYYDEIDCETGEIVKSYLIKEIGRL